jgi:hypothetical protein
MHPAGRHSARRALKHRHGADPCCGAVWPDRQCSSDARPVVGVWKGLDKMNQIIWIVGLVVIVLFILGYLGLR